MPSIFVSSKVLRNKEHHFVTSPFVVVTWVAMFLVIADVILFLGINALRFLLTN